MIRGDAPMTRALETSRSPRVSLRWGRVVRLAAVLVLSGCGREPVEVPPLRLVLPDSAIADSFGSLDGPSGVGALTMITDAALSGSGRFLAVGDYTDPFVHVLDRETGESWAFGQRGQGPGELIMLYSMEFTGDSLIRLLSSSRLEEFTAAGDWLRGWRPADLGLRAVAFEGACSGRLFYHGNETHRRAVDSTAWLFEAIGPAEPPRPRLFQPGVGVSRSGPWVWLQGSAHGVAALHQQGEAETLYWIPCDGAAVVMDRWGFSVSSRAAESSSGAKGRGYTLPDTLFWGLAVEGETIVYALTFKDGEARVTSLMVREGEACASLELFGSWTLFDLHRDLMLLAQHDPFPAVKAVSWRWVQEHLTPSRCPA